MNSVNLNVVLVVVLVFTVALLLSVPYCTRTQHQRKHMAYVRASRQLQLAPSPLRERRLLSRLQHSGGTVVPKRIFQTWHSTDMAPRMKEATETLRAAHPDFEYVFMNDRQCRQFIADNFDASVVDAFDALIPGAYKADLWRLCVLYKLGGIYVDIKYIPVKPFTFRDLLDGPHFTKDRKYMGLEGIYNAFMVCPPGDARLLSCILHVVQNVQQRFYGTSPLAISGPALVAEHIDINGDDVDLKYVVLFSATSANYMYVTYRKYVPFFTKPLLRCYKGYREDQKKNQLKHHYGSLWKQRKIYNDHEQQQQQDGK